MGVLYTSNELVLYLRVLKWEYCIHLMSLCYTWEYTSNELVLYLRVLSGSIVYVRLKVRIRTILGFYCANRGS